MASASPAQLRAARYLGFLLDCTPEPELRALYFEAVAILEPLRDRVASKYVRQHVEMKHGDGSSNPYGLFSKVPPEQRLVPEESDWQRHVALAMRLEFPSRLQSAQVSAACSEVVEAVNAIINTAVITTT